MSELNEQELQSLYAWIDDVPLTRQKKNIARDFSDGVMAAELSHHFFPRLVELHNYTPANSTGQKLENWRTLNRKVFCKLDFTIPDELLHELVTCKPGAIEYVLNHLKKKVELFYQRQMQQQTVGNPFSLLSPMTEGLTSNNTLNIIHQDVPRHDVISSPPPSHTHLMGPLLIKQNHSTHLPPIIKSPATDHPQTKNSKPSHIPRPRHSGNSSESRHTLPSIVTKVSNLKSVGSGTTSKTTKLPSIKDGISKKKPSYSGQHPVFTTKGTGTLEMAEKDQVIMELQETIQLLSMKVTRLEHLIRIKEFKIQELEKNTRN